MEKQVVANPSASNDARFGISVAMDGDVIVVGADRVDTTATNGGAAYVYRRNSGTGLWDYVQTLEEVTLAEDDRFGYDVAIDGNTIVVGAWGTDGSSNDEGAAYVYTYKEPTWELVQVLTA